MPLLAVRAYAPALLAVFGLSAVPPTYGAQQLREVAITQNIPVIMVTHDQTGASVSSGGGISLSGNWRSVNLDINSLPASWFVNLVAQLQNGHITHSVGFYRHDHKRILIDEFGIVSPEGTAVPEQNGPYIEIGLHRAKDFQHQIIVKSAQVTATSLTGAMLPTEVSPDGTITISKAPPSTILLSVTSSSNSTWQYRLFPYLREARRGIISYDINSVPVSGSLAPSPQ